MPSPMQALGSLFKVRDPGIVDYSKLTYPDHIFEDPIPFKDPTPLTTEGLIQFNKIAQLANSHRNSGGKLA